MPKNKEKNEKKYKYPKDSIENKEKKRIQTPKIIAK